MEQNNGPPLISMSQQLQNQFSNTTYLELILITLALLSSLVLSLSPSSRGSSACSTGPYMTPLFALIATLFAVIALVLFCVVLVLGWLRAISLDALASVLFALVPSLLSMPFEVFQYWYLRYLMSTRIPLHVPKSSFSYIRYGPDWRRGSGGSRMYIRLVAFPEESNLIYSLRTFLQPSSFRSIWLAAEEEEEKWRISSLEELVALSANVAIQAQNESEDLNNAPNLADSQWSSSEGSNQPLFNSVAYGTITEHRENLDVMRDTDDGITAWWWEAVTTATRLVAKPSVVRVSSKERILNALTLLSDIIAIGAFVLKYRRGFIEDQLKHSPAVRSSLTATPGIMCNLILKELGLEEWGQIGPEMRASDYQYPTYTNLEYGILFVILAQKSRMFIGISKEHVRRVDRIRRTRKSLQARQDPAGRLLQLQEEGQTNVLTEAKRTILGRTGQRISGQEITDRMHEAGDKPEEEFCKLAQESVDDWLFAWGCSRDLSTFDAKNEKELNRAAK